MGGKRIRNSHGRRRGIGRTAAFFFALALAVGTVGCGGGADRTTAAEKSADAEILDGALERELTAIDAYTHGIGHLRGRSLALARRLRAQDQEYVDALTKAARGLGAPLEAEAAQLETAGRGAAAALELAYEQENAALAYYLDAVRHLETRAPRAVSASIASGHAQHLVVVRQLLGAPLIAADPEAFESGDIPPPAEPSANGTKTSK